MISDDDTPDARNTEPAEVPSGSASWQDFRQYALSVFEPLSSAVRASLTRPAPAPANEEVRVDKDTSRLGESYRGLQTAWGRIEAQVRTAFQDEGWLEPLASMLKLEPLAEDFRIWHWNQPVPNLEPSLNTVINWVTSVLRDAPGFMLTNEALDDEISEFQQTIAESSIPVRTIAPLSGFASTYDEIPLDDGVSICRITADEMEAIKNFNDSETLFDGEQPTFAIKVEADLPPSRDGRSLGDFLGTLFDDRGEIVELVGDALRLYRFESDLSFPSMFHLRTRPKPLHVVSSSFSGTITHPFHQYGFQEDDVKKFQRVFSLVKSFQEDRGISLAIRRFSQAAARGSGEDGLLDLVISSEAALGCSSRNAALRTAFLLGNSPVERQHLLEICMGAVDVRNRIVHGNEPRIPEPYRHAHRLRIFYGDVIARLIQALMNLQVTGEQLPDWNALISGTVSTPCPHDLRGLPEGLILDED